MTDLARWILALLGPQGDPHRGEAFVAADDTRPGDALLNITATAKVGSPASRGSYSRCSSLMQKASLGTPLTQDERREMGEFCR